MLGYIIGTISDLDAPRTPSQKGEMAYARYFRKYTKDMMVSNRKAVLEQGVKWLLEQEKIEGEQLKALMNTIEYKMIN